MSGLNSLSSRSLVKIGLQKQQKPIRIMVLGQSAVGKSGELLFFGQNNFFARGWKLCWFLVTNCYGFWVNLKVNFNVNVELESVEMFVYFATILRELSENFQYEKSLIRVISVQTNLFIIFVNIKRNFCK